ncbi:hypothetical protein INT43_004811 [Umbelopsis isabellina]|uniref:Required for respiratory growth protein 9, mitochondrial n=1 Tax=Mortierella isabellina TaxID=91625 RepID=A0A8H7PEM9_MORIS|nr:hypothetical protein INT43_004811 [Umbelopsis isabellina]
MLRSKFLLASGSSSLLRTCIPVCSPRLVAVQSMSTIDRRSFQATKTSETELNPLDEKTSEKESDQAANDSAPLHTEDIKEDVPQNWRKDKSLPQFVRHKYAMKEKLEGKPWQPRNRVSREVMNEMKRLSEMDPEKWNAKTLAVEFKKSPEAIRRILKSRYIPK